MDSRSILAVAVFLFAVVRPADAQQLALVGGMLLDGYEGPAIHNATVLIDGDRIVAVGPADQVEVPGSPAAIGAASRTTSNTW